MSNPTFTRLGSANTYDTARNNLMARQTTLVNTQQQLTSGKRVNSASDDPTAAAQAERALTRISRIQTDQRALDAQRNAITQAESTLGDMNDALQNFRELVVNAGSGTVTAAERTIIAGQLQGLRDQIFALSNRKDTNGQPLFGALASALTPFVGPQGTAPDYTFQGLPGQTASTEVAIPFSVDGDSAFMYHPARDGVYNAIVTQATPGATVFNTSPITLTNASLANGSSYTLQITGVDTTTVPGTTTVTYDVAGAPTAVVGGVGLTASYPTSASGGTFAVTAMPGLSMSVSGNPKVGDQVKIDPSPSIFSVLDSAIRDIGSAANNNNASQAVAQALHNIDSGMSRVSAVRGQAGDLLNRADKITDNQTKRSIQLEGDRSRAEDLDMIKGISDFQNQQTGYQAALQSYAQVQKLSLFNYIS